MTTLSSQSASRTKSRWAALAAVTTAGLLLSGVAFAADMGVHPSGRYYQDSSGKPMFLIGYYGWAAVPDGYSINDAGFYSSMMTQGSPYKINYIRVSLGVNHFTSSTNPPVYQGSPTPVPFIYLNGKAVLANTTTLPNTINWDPVFWNGLAAQCALAKQNGVFIHVSIFDGVELRDQGGASYGYNNSFWNPSNQDKAYYAAGNYGDCGGCFYRLSDFNNNTGIGYYQRAVIDKTCATVAPYDNVLLELGNELLGSDPTWNSTVIAYIKTKTAKPVSVVGTDVTGIQGFSMHQAADLPGLKTELAGRVGRGYPAWEDPDGSQIGYLDADGQRRCMWYSFAGGAGCYGGFTTDFWTWPINPPPGFNIARGTYCRNLQNFISTTSIPFWTMIPQGSLVSNSSVNLCLAAQGSSYMAYILNDATATVDLGGVSGSAYYKLYDPKAGTLSAQSTLAGGAVRSFSKPSGADDWVIYIYTTIPPAGQTLNVKPAGAITIDGDPSDWNLTDFTAPGLAGQQGAGDYALIGFYNGNLYYASYAGVLPTSPADHTAKVYVRHDANYLYFLVRDDDDNINFSNPPTSNWANDCLEIYIDPGHAGGSTPIADSTSDIQLVIDANNQKNAYMATPAYATQVLNGVISAVQRDATGWWLEARIAKNAFSPPIPSSGTFGLDFNFRDNDNNNDPALTTVYTWCDNSYQGFPSKIPDRWGNAVVTSPCETPYPGPAPASLPGVIQAENYDTCGEGVGYHDSDTINSGGAYRTDGVDIQATTDIGGGYNVGWIVAGEWLAYTVNVSASCYYDIKVRVAAPGAGGIFHIEMNGQPITGPQTVPNTGGAQTWTTVTVPGISLSAGQQILKIVADAGGWNLNWIEAKAPLTVLPSWNTLGQTTNLGSGQTPGVATDSQGNVHVVYMNGASIYYRKYAPPCMMPLISETIPVPTGGSNFTCPHLVCDSNDVPHLVFTQGWGYSPAIWYTNRMGGTWKTAPFAAMVGGSVAGSVTRYPRLVILGQYAFVSSTIWLGNDGGSVWGRIVRLSNIAGTPAVDRSAEPQYIRCTIAANGAGHICASGRYGAGGHFFQEYDQDLNPVGSTVEWSVGKAGKTNSPSGICGDKNGVVHMFTDAFYTSLDMCQMIYNNTSRRNANGTFQNCIRGLNGGAPGTGPDPATEIQYNSGWWNDEVWPVCAVDAIGRVYVAYAGWTNLPLKGCVTTVNASGFLEPPSQFTSNMYYQTQEYNCEIAPAVNGGVYIVWQGSDGSCYLRGVGVGSTVDDVTPPRPVTNLAAAGTTDKVTLSWTNPTDLDFTGVMIRTKAGGFPTSISDGTLLVDQAGTPGSTDSYVHVGTICNISYYYAVFAYDASFNYSEARTVTAKGSCWDFDGDGDVDMSDFAVLQACYSDSSIPAPADCRIADFNGDGYVDQADFLFFQACFNGPSRPAACAP